MLWVLGGQRVAHARVAPLVGVFDQTSDEYTLEEFRFLRLVFTELSGGQHRVEWQHSGDGIVFTTRRTEVFAYPHDDVPFFGMGTYAPSPEPMTLSGEFEEVSLRVCE